MAEDLGSPLTEEQVATLEEDTPIVVLWGGGNGPHRYRVHVDPLGQRYAASLDRRYPHTDEDNPLDFVGQERYHTRVWLTSSPDPKP